MFRSEFSANLLVFIVLLLFSPSHGSGTPVTVHSSRTIDTLGSGGPNGYDTLGVTLRFFAEGSYDTVAQIDTVYDTTRIPLDVVLSFDLSTSMAIIDKDVDISKRARIVWAKLAALRFLDSLKKGDRISIMGWTSAGNVSGLSDTSNSSKYYQKWRAFTSNLDSARAFIRDSLFIDSTKLLLDTCENVILTVRNIIPNGTFSYTPMRISSVLAAGRLARYGRTGATRSVIMLTDGENNDKLPRNTATAFLDSLKRTQQVRFNAIGFVSGDTGELRALTNAGGGRSYNATNRRQLDSVYAALAREIVEQKIDTTVSTMQIIVQPDTVRMPVDVLLAIDLSSSMNLTDGSLRTRIAWAKIAALGFLDSLGPQDRVAVLGWTSSIDGNIHLADAGNRALYYQKWCRFTSELDNVRAFIRDSLYLDISSRFSDTYKGKPMVLWDSIPDGEFGNTPLRVSSIVSMSYLSQSGRREANRVAIMLTDGINNDAEPLPSTAAFIDSLRRSVGMQLHTIGFMSGDTAELRALSLAGGGNFYNAKDNAEIFNAYATLAHQMVVEKVAARKLMVQEVLVSPPLRFMAGTQKFTANCTVPLESVESFTDDRGYTILRWYFKTIPVWGTAEVFYKITTPGGTAIGVDSAYAGNGFYSGMVFTDDAGQILTINLKQSGNGPLVGTSRKAIPPPTPLFVKRGGRTLSIRPGGQLQAELLLYTISGRLVWRAAGEPRQAENCVMFRIPETIPSGNYAVCLVFENSAVRKSLHLVR